ncbi:insulinase family protein [Niveibacterium sp. 24ML]|uniref:M16 family metallopeptidase n=1 Tax=Niveibacterium sp. 24ML TaxID=2985512 RepID=UPI00226E7F9B|nr:pitrilysin family protein [Niveibacterium sp. 24ML]MCX9157629.1 insulinase family protein [Niveibacterium sp. 24ML]
MSFISALMRATALGFCLIAASPVFAAEPAVRALPALPAGIERGSTVEGITEYRLANGLRVLLAPDATKPSTTVNITYLVGSRHESYGETGMAHLLEHLMFKGSKSFPGNTIDSEFKRRGMQMNGTTWFDRTNYYETFAASDDNLDWALRMEADRMVNAFIAREDLDAEMTVVRNEMEAGENSPGQMLWEKMAATAYQWHNYGKSTIGARSDVEGVRIENLQAFYARYYQPDNAVLIITGKFDEAAALQKVQAYFAPIPRPTRVLQPTWTREPTQDGEREVSLSRVGDIQLVGVQYHVPAGAHPDTAALSLLAFVLGDSPSGRLHKALVESGKAASVSAWNLELAEPGYMSFVAQLNQKQSRAEVRKVLVDVIENIARKPLSAAEVERARVALLNGFEKMLNDPVDFGVGLSEAIALGDWRLFFLGRDRIEGASLADVQRVAERYFKAANRTVGQFIPVEKPVRVEIPAVPPLADTLAGYAGKTAQAEGEVFEPSPENIEARTTRSRLSSGAQLALLPKRTRGNTVHGQIVLRMGNERSLVGQETVASFTAAMLTRGAAGRNRQQIADALDALKAQLSITAQDGNLVLVSFDTRRDKLTAFLDLLQDVLRRPTFPAGELEQLRTEALAELDAARREPQAVAMRALGRHDNPWPKGDVRYVATAAEEAAAIKAVSARALAGFHRRFYGAEHAQIALVGDFDAVAVKPQLERLTAGWRSAEAYARVPQPFRAKAPKVISLETPDKANAFFIAGLTMPLRDESADYPAAVLANQVLGDGAGLKSRLADRLRQKEGLSYGAGSVLRGNAREENTALMLYAIYAPQNLPRLRASLDDELQRFVRDGVSEQELNEARTGLIQQMTLGRTQDAALASALASQLDLGRTMAFERAREAALNAVSVDDVNAAIRKYFDPAKLVQVFAGDFKTAESK